MLNILIRECEPGAVVDQHALGQFQKQWSTYQKLVDADALSRRAAGKILHDDLASIPAPFDFLDIAFGDAGQMPGASRHQCRPYQGIDLSELAARNLSSTAFEVEFDHRDFVQAQHANAAWCGLSIHHLTRAECET